MSEPSVPWTWWRATSRRSDLALDALEQAICERSEAEGGPLVHHSDRGSQYLSIRCTRCTEQLAEAGIEPSVGSRGDSYDNALAETVIGTSRRRSFGDGVRGAVSRTSSSPPWNGSGGSTPTASSDPSAMYPLRSTRRPTTLVWRLNPSPPDSTHRVSDESGAVQTARSRATAIGGTAPNQLHEAVQQSAAPRPDRPQHAPAQPLPGPSECEWKPCKQVVASGGAATSALFIWPSHGSLVGRAVKLGDIGNTERDVPSRVMGPAWGPHDRRMAPLGDGRVRMKVFVLGPPVSLRRW